MEQIYKKAKAKINLSLNVLEKRKDHYHNIESVMQILYFYDELWIERTNKEGITIKCNNQEIKEEENIIYKAYWLLRKKYQISGVKVKLIKKIPTQAGLGGGSADAATFLKGMNELFSLGISMNELEVLGIELGSDVPTVLHQGCILAKRKGEELERVHTNLKYYIILIKPDISFSTKEMYQKIDFQEKNMTQKFVSKELKQALERENIEQACHYFYNVFEDVSQNKIIEMIKNDLKEQGALVNQMTGSGSCVFGIFKEKEQAKNAYHRLKTKYEKCYFTIPNYGEKGE